MGYFKIAFAQFEGQVNNLFPADRCCNLHNYIPFIFPNVAKDPLKDAMLTLTDGSFSGRAAYVVNGERIYYEHPRLHTQSFTARLFSEK